MDQKNFFNYKKAQSENLVPIHQVWFLVTCWVPREADY